MSNTMCIICKTKRPTYNEIGQTKPLYCKACSLTTGLDMIDVVHKKVYYM